jgi:hypothetical protein
MTGEAAHQPSGTCEAKDENGGGTENLSAAHIPMVSGVGQGQGCDLVHARK